MANAIEIMEVVVAGTNKKGDAVFEARGTLNEREFLARTIQWKGEPIFKVQENGEDGLAHLVMADSAFSRGERISIARACKAARLEKFGDGHKEVVEAELEAGEVVNMAATENAEEAAA